MQPEELAKRIKTGNAPAVVDVRTGFEFKKGHIPGALHAPTWKIVLRMVQLPPDKERELVVHCEHGPRARIAKSLLEYLGYRKVGLLEGHMAGWRRGGFPTQK